VDIVYLWSNLVVKRSIGGSKCWSRSNREAWLVGLCVGWGNEAEWRQGWVGEADRIGKCGGVGEVGQVGKKEEQRW